MNKENELAGVVGMGLMGTSITACLLASGHSVCSIEVQRSQRASATKHLKKFLQKMHAEGLLKSKPKTVLRRFKISGDYRLLEKCKIVLEAVSENISLKKDIIRQVENVVNPKALIASNTSAIPVTLLQKGSRYPQRILGIHWAEPAHITRFMEIIRGRQTSLKNAIKARKYAEGWGKEPSLLNKDIRGFITNRLFYAILREAFHLVEKKIASPEDIDRSIRNDLGYWITLAGPFRFMDLTGIPAYQAVAKDLFPELSCAQDIPPFLKKLVGSGARGVSNAKGFYPYSEQSAMNWEKIFIDFSFEVRRLAMKYNRLAAHIELKRLEK